MSKKTVLKETKAASGIEKEGSQSSLAAKQSSPAVPADAQEMEVVTLTKDEQKEKAAYEDTIAKFHQSFVEVGYALWAIKGKKLYRDEYGTFEKYCKGKWGFTRAYAFMITDAYQVTKLLPENADLPKPTSEYQVRPLTKIKPDAVPKVWEKAVELAGNREPSHTDVNRAIVATKAERNKPEVRRRRKEKSKSGKAFQLIEEALDSLNQGKHDAAKECLVDLKRELENILRRD